MNKQKHYVIGWTPDKDFDLESKKLYLPGPFCMKNNFQKKIFNVLIQLRRILQ